MIKSFVMLMALLMLVLSACTSTPEQSFEEFANTFYTQMFTDGDQTEVVSDMYETLTEDYESNADEELYVAIENMYEALGTGVDATKYQLEVMALINE